MLSMCSRRWQTPAVLLALALLAGCGRAEQTVQPTSLAPLAPASTTALPAAQTATLPPSARLAPPVPNSTAAYLRTRIAFNRNSADATITAEAAWAQTPEPTILPPKDGPRLRDVWHPSPQQATTPTRLYLRSPSYDEWDPDLFWEVRLPNAQLRRLPAVEQPSLGDTALVSPDGRFLAYVTDRSPTLRLLDLASDADTGIQMPINAVRCFFHRRLAWSPDGRTLAVLVRNGPQPSWTSQLLLVDPRSGTAPQPLLQLPGVLELLGWLDDQHLLALHWNLKVVEPARLLSVDRQGNQTPIRDIAPGIPRCSSLSPDGRDLIYEHDHRTYRVQLATGQEVPFPTDPDEFFWVGDGRTLLVSPFTQTRTVWLRSLDHPERGRSLFLSPPYQSDYRFGITGVSPDGRLLVACEQPFGNNPRIRSTTARTWLYEIAQDRWTVLRDSATDSCDLVLGWGTLGATQ